MRTVGTMLMQQAPMTVEVYLHEVIKMIDNEFGEGFAKKNPSLVSSLVDACVADFSAGDLGFAIRSISEQIGRFINWQQEKTAHVGQWFDE